MYALTREFGRLIEGSQVPPSQPLRMVLGRTAVCWIQTDWRCYGLPLVLAVFNQPKRFTLTPLAKVSSTSWQMKP